MKKVKNIFHKIANADPMIWGYVMLNDRLKNKLKRQKAEAFLEKESDKCRKGFCK